MVGSLMEKVVNHGLIIHFQPCLISGMLRIDGGVIGQVILKLEGLQLRVLKCGRLVKG